MLSNCEINNTSNTINKKFTPTSNIVKNVDVIDKNVKILINNIKTNLKNRNESKNNSEISNERNTISENTNESKSNIEITNESKTNSENTNESKTNNISHLEIIQNENNSNNTNNPNNSNNSNNSNNNEQCCDNISECCEDIFECCDCFCGGFENLCNDFCCGCDCFEKWFIKSQQIFMWNWLIFGLLGLFIYSIVFSFNFIKYESLRLFYIIIPIIIALLSIITCIVSKILVNAGLIAMHSISILIIVLLNIQYIVHYLALNSFTFTYVPILIIDVFLLINIIFLTLIMCLICIK
jgi:hypothetical protein